MGPSQQGPFETLAIKESAFYITKHKIPSEHPFPFNSTANNSKLIQIKLFILKTVTFFHCQDLSHILLLAAGMQGTHILVVPTILHPIMQKWIPK